MNGKKWIDSFMGSLTELEKESETKTDADWTRFMEKVMKNMEQKTNCYVVCRNTQEKKYSGEYLNIDAMFFDNAAYEDWKTDEYDPPVFPSAVVELENDDKLSKITYCLWKILCIHADVRVLVCYQKNAEKIELLRRNLENTVKSHNLMVDRKGELLLIIGDETKGGAQYQWDKYFNIYVWKNEKFIKQGGA